MNSPPVKLSILQFFRPSKGFVTIPTAGDSTGRKRDFDAAPGCVMIFSTPMMDINRLLTDLAGILSSRPDILFAYLHGSVLTGENPRDIDVAVFLRLESPEAEDPIETAIELCLEAEKRIGSIPVDVKVLNGAPVAFRFAAVSGRLIFSRDEDRRVDFLASTWSEYFDFKPLADRYLREVRHDGL
jgi:predicted nucleotidyltransferase